MWLHKGVPLTISPHLSRDVTWSDDHLTLWVSFHHHKSSLCQVWWSPVLGKRRYFVFNLSHDLTWALGHRVMWHYEWVSLTLSLHPVTFGDHRHVEHRKKIVCLSRDLTRLCGQRVMWRYGWVSLIISDYPTKFGDHRRFGRGNIKLSICRVTSCYHVVRWSCSIMGEFFLS